MTDRPWKQEERQVARLLGGNRYPANSGGRVDVEALPLEMQAVGAESGKVGVVVIKRRAGSGRDTPRLVVMTEEVWRRLTGMPRQTPSARSQQHQEEVQRLYGKAYGTRPVGAL